MTPEGRVKKLVKDIIAGVPNTYSHWPVQNGMGAPTLDCVGARPWDGKMFAVETKAPGQRNKITQRQIHTAGKMRESGVIVFVIDGDGPDAALFRVWLDPKINKPEDLRDLMELEGNVNARFKELANRVSRVLFEGKP